MASRSDEGTPRRAPEGSPSKGSQSNGSPSKGSGSTGSRARRPELSSIRAAQRAVVQLHELTTRDIEAVVGMSKTDSGNWKVVVEVVEAHHFPDTSDVMAEYSVDVNAKGELVGYSRGERYLRGRPGGQ